MAKKQTPQYVWVSTQKGAMVPPLYFFKNRRNKMSIKNRINMLEETLDQKKETQDVSQIDAIIIGTQKEVDTQLERLKKQRRLDNGNFEPLVIILPD